MAENLINRILFGNYDSDNTSSENRKYTKYVPASIQKFNEDHIKKFEIRQQQLLEKKEKAEKYKDFPTSSQEKIPSVKFKKAEVVKPLNNSVPTYVEKMTNTDVAEMLKEKQVFSLKQIEKFFENKINQKICFEGVPVIVQEVFPRSECVAIKFKIRTSDIGQLTLNRSLNEVNGHQPAVEFNSEGSESIKLFGEIQGKIAESFKVLFK